VDVVVRSSSHQAALETLVTTDPDEVRIAANAGEKNAACRDAQGNSESKKALTKLKRGPSPH
jgi:hypothetical protein